VSYEIKYGQQKIPAYVKLKRHDKAVINERNVKWDERVCKDLKKSEGIHD
jgi:hypothetical protein